MRLCRLCPYQLGKKLLVRVVPALDGIHAAAVDAAQLCVVLRQSQREQLSGVDFIAETPRQRAEVLDGVVRTARRDQLFLECRCLVPEREDRPRTY